MKLISKEVPITICEDHPAYAADKEPNINCDCCWELWNRNHPDSVSDKIFERKWFGGLEEGFGFSWLEAVEEISAALDEKLYDDRQVWEDVKNQPRLYGGMSGFEATFWCTPEQFDEELAHLESIRFYLNLYLQCLEKRKV